MGGGRDGGSRLGWRRIVQKHSVQVFIGLCRKDATVRGAKFDWRKNAPAADVTENSWGKSTHRSPVLSFLVNYLLYHLSLS